ncbi:conserved hypothetical protein [Pediculus humanus corporis]|uniref:MOG interacting and ectopic P-granules protein 1 n=1 Tax=Pediculus humanus subsp. corporis TaxID=121224 RepID=E0VZT7_PEDHC|nr:uncharacterized protein Phum_PHUM538050 [Pediculus humanus corporis]EEB18893.1 conserved hypothetical protein [Pediculus humanus corporis]
METISTEGSNSSEALKDFSATKIKLNGDVNGSMNVIDVDPDSRDSDFKKEIKDSLGGDASNDSSSKIKNGGEHSSDTDAENGDNSRDSLNSKLKNNNSNSHQDFHELMEVDDDESVPSEGGNVGNCDSENNQSNSDKSKKVSDVEIVGESEEKIEDGESVKKDNAEVSNTENSKEVIEISSDQSDENNSKPGKDKESKEDKENGECKSENTKKSGKAKEGSAATEKNTNESSEAPKKIKEPQVVITPRRSSRTIQRPVRFGHEAPSNSSEDDVGNDSDEIEEITPQDPLADTIADIRKIPRKIGNTTIVVKDTKRLADIAARNTNTNKKEPTLVIIDTNSILSGRGAVPMAQSGSPQIQIPSVTVTPQPHIQSGGTGSLPQQSHHAKPYTGLPAATLPAQGIIPTKSVQRPPPILPMLTDDMYVVEAPSFIVPYVYEKPPVKKFKKYVKKMLKQIKIQEEEEEAKKEENQKEKESKESKESDKETTSEDKKPDSDEKEKSEVIVLEENEKSSEEKKDENLLKEKNGEGEDKNKKSDENLVTPKKEEEKTVSCDNNTDNSVILNEVKKKDDSIITCKEVSVVKKIKGKENKKDGKSSSSEDDDDEDEEEKKKPTTGGSYFDNPLGKFFMQIGMNLVQQFVQTDLLKQHKKKQKMGKGNDDTQMAINSLKKNLQMSKENNEPYTMEQNKCDYCSFKTESKLIMAHHLETPHMRNYVYRCNFCPLEVRGPHDILFHMEAEHNIRGRLERAPAFHQCPQCPFEDNQKGKLTRHLLTCAKKFRAEKNLEPPMDWEPPAKIPRMTRKPPNMPMNVNNTLYQQVRMGSEMVAPLNNQQNALLRARGRPNFPPIAPGTNPKIMLDKRPIQSVPPRANMVYRPGANTGSQQMIVPSSSYQLAGNQIFQVPVKLLNQPSISITPLPRQTTNNQPSTSSGVTVQRQAGAAGNSNTTFVICEICDGYVKHLEQLRNHMQWIHKVKIHPKMICNRPPLNCQKCQFRFFTDQGLERHLLGSHGLVTSSMQESANEGKDGGRCPVCGRAYQWKLLNHVARDHNMTLKPAHLSYKCTVCTATFGMYKQFENHVYSAHSVVAKRVMDRRNGQSSSSASTSSVGFNFLSNISNRSDPASQVKPFKISDEITIIPQRSSKHQSLSSNRSVPGTSRVSIQVVNNMIVFFGIGKNTKK